MKTPLIMSHDLGTTGDKACLWDVEGRLIASVRCPYPLQQPNPTWAEQNPKDWWKAFMYSTKSLIKLKKIKPKDVVALGFSGQMMGCLPVDSRGEPLRPCIIWMDQRSTRQADEIKRRIGEWNYYNTTGVRPNATWSLSKIMWLRDNLPEVLRRTYKFLMAKDYLVMRLTGNFITDYSDASLSGGISVTDKNWAFEIFKDLGISSDYFPEIRKSAYVAGELNSETSSSLGLAKGTRVILGGGDGPCATVGAGCVDEGDFYSYIGTSAWISAVTSKHLVDPEMRFFNMWHLDPCLFTPAGTMQMAGGSLEWMKGILFEKGRSNLAYKDMESLASEVEPGSKGLIFLPYLMGERAPIWDSKSRGVFCGLTLSHRKGHLIRALIEGVSINLKLILESFEETGLKADVIRLIGGATKSRLWRRILTDCFGHATVLVENPEEATSRGAMIAAAVGEGLHKNFKDAVTHITTQERLEPDKENFQRYEATKVQFIKIYQQLKPVFSLSIE